MTTEERLVSPEFYRVLEEKYGVLQEYFDEAVEAAKALSKDRILLAQAASDADAILGAETSGLASKAIHAPETENDLLNRYYRLLILLAHAPEAAESYRKRGFSEAEIRVILEEFHRASNASEQKYGETGLRPMYFGWLCIYVRGEIFHLGKFEFQVNRLSSPVVYFKNKALGTSIAMASGGTFHRSGRALGSAGCTDEQDAFSPVITETAGAYTGCITVNHGESVSKTPVSLSKSDWTPVLRQGDGILNFHIAKGAPIQPENVIPLMEAGFRIAKERYPEWNLKALYCSSWLLDPTIRDLLGETSNIVRFGDLFTRFPHKSAGTEIFSFVFPLACKDLPPEKWPADTRLMRALADRYASGGFVTSYEGAVLKDELML